MVIVQGLEFKVQRLEIRTLKILKTRVSMKLHLMR